MRFLIVLLLTGGCGAAGRDHVALTELVHFEQLRANPRGGLVYLSDRSGGWEVWAANESGQERQLSSLGVVVDSPSVAPDGRRVVFAADRGGDEKYDLFEVALSDGASPQRLTETPWSESAPGLSPDGERLAWLSDEGRPNKPQLVVGDASGGNGETMTSHDVPVAWPLWSPTNGSVALTRTAD